MNGSTVASICPDDILPRVVNTSTGDPSPCLLPYIIPTHTPVSPLTRMFSPVSTSLYSYVSVPYLISYHLSPIYALYYYVAPEEV